MNEEITPEEKAAVAQVESRIARMMREADERLEKWRQRQIKKYGHVPAPIKCPRCNQPIGRKGDAPARKMHNPITGADYYQHEFCRPERKKMGDLPKGMQEVIRDEQPGGGPNPEDWREER